MPDEDLTLDPTPEVPTPAVATLDSTPIERPESFEPFERWKAEWKPFENYLTLAQVKERIGDMDLAEVLARCQCIGKTMHVEQEIPASVWTDPTWKWDVDENTCGPSMYSDHLQFQVQVYGPDVETALRGPPPPREDPPPPSFVVEVVEGLEGLPEGWGMRTFEGLVWQSYKDATCGPMRSVMSQAIGDAWSYQTAGTWL